MPKEWEMRNSSAVMFQIPDNGGVGNARTIDIVRSGKLPPLGPKNPESLLMDVIYMECDSWG